MGTYAVRTGGSTDRVTFGLWYSLRWEGLHRYITDNNGDRMKPSLGNADYWETTTTHQPSTCDLPLNARPEDSALDNAEPKTQTNHNEGDTMLTIEDAVLIDKKESATFSDEILLKLVEKEQNHLEHLESLKISGSKAVKKLHAQHKDNIARLVEILDSRVAE